MSIFGRAGNLLKGFIKGSVGPRDRSLDDPSAPRGDVLASSIATIVAVQRKFAGQLAEATRRLRDVQGKLESAIDRDDDPAALELVREKDRLSGDIDVLRTEVAEQDRATESVRRALLPESERSALQRARESIDEADAQASAVKEIADASRKAPVPKTDQEQLARIKAKRSMGPSPNDPGPSTPSGGPEKPKPSIKKSMG